MDKQSIELTIDDLIQNKCCKLELVQYNYDVDQKSYRIFFKIIAVTEECPNEVTNEVANEVANEVTANVNFKYRIELIIPDKIETLQTGNKYIIKIITSEGIEQKQLLLSIENQNDVLDEWIKELKRTYSKNKLTEFEMSRMSDHFNTKFGSPYYVYGKFYDPKTVVSEPPKTVVSEPIRIEETGGAPVRKSRRSRKSRKSSKKSTKSGKKSRRNSRR